MKKVIFNADDYGHTRNVSRGIRDTITKGVLCSTTAMMNMKAVREDIELLLEECPETGLGVHLNITTGFPVSAPSEIPTLVDENGAFHHNEYYLRNIDKIDPDDVALEWGRQIEKFISFTGQHPDHLDSHHHAANFSVDFFRYFLEYAEKYECGIRCPEAFDRVDLLDAAPEQYRLETAARISEMLKQTKVWYPDHFSKNFYGENSSLEGLSAILGRLEDGVTEIMCHPAYSDDELRTMSVYIENRDIEGKIIMSHELRAYLIENQIETTSFRKEMKKV